MVRDGYLYPIPLVLAAFLLGWLARPAWGIVPLLPAAFLLWFFRDPQREIPQEHGALVSPADGKVTDVVPAGRDRTRISIFLSVFDVHVNRSPISGTIWEVRYQKGKFMNAMNRQCVDFNEQNVVTVEGEGQTVVFKQIAGLVARRIVFNPKVGEGVERGHRVGMIKFGSRVDVLFDATARVNVRIGDRVKGGASVLAYLEPGRELAAMGESASAGKVR